MCGRALHQPLYGAGSETPSACKFAPFSRVIIATVEYVCAVQPSCRSTRGEQPALSLWINTGKWNREAAVHKYLMQSQVNPAHELYLIIKQLLLSCLPRVAQWQQTTLCYNKIESVSQKITSRALFDCRAERMQPAGRLFKTSCIPLLLAGAFALMLWNGILGREHWLRARRRFNQLGHYYCWHFIESFVSWTEWNTSAKIYAYITWCRSNSNPI